MSLCEMSLLLTPNRTQNPPEPFRRTLTLQTLRCLKFKGPLRAPSVDQPITWYYTLDSTGGRPKFTPCSQEVAETLLSWEKVDRLLVANATNQPTTRTVGDRFNQSPHAGLDAGSEPDRRVVHQNNRTNQQLFHAGTRADGCPNGYDVGSAR